MQSDIRQSGIDVIGEVPWGTHFCQFYENNRDLIETLVPYFREGLSANEFCMWITSAPLQVDQATEALRAEVPDLDKFIENGQIEILDYSQWYTRSGKFSADEVLQGWVDKLSAALERGFEGLRLSGNTFWLEQADWDDFTRYEEAVNNIIGQYRMLAICTYCLQKCSALEILDVVANHQFALIKRIGQWQIIKSAQQIKTAQALQESEQRYAITLASIGDAVIAKDVGGRITFMNAMAERLTGWTFHEASMLPVTDVFNIINEFSRQKVEDPVAKVLKMGTIVGLANHTILIRKDGTEVAIDDSGAPIKDRDGNTSGVVLVFRDITERKQMEEKSRIEERRLRGIIKIAQHNPKSVRELLDYALDEAIALSESKLGYILYYKEDKREFVLHAWSKDAMNVCSIPHPPMVYQLDNTGIWGEAVRQRQPIVINDFLAPNPLKKGYPEGHAHLFRFMTVPIFIDDHIVAVVAVANKATNYSDQDVRQLNMMMDSIWAIAERKRAEEALKASEERAKDQAARLQAILDVAPAIIWTAFDKECQNISGNKAAHEFSRVPKGTDMSKTGSEPEKLEHYRIFQDGVELAPEEMPLQRVAASGQEINDLSLDFHFDDGTVRSLLGNVKPITDSKGRRKGTVAAFLDITERKQAEETLLKTRNYLENLIDYANAPIIVWDPSFRITRFNHAFERLTGIRASEALGEPLSILFPEASREESLDYIRRALAGERWEAVEIPILKADGSIRTVLWNSANIYDKNQTNIIATIAQGQDITDRKLAEDELRKARDELEAKILERTADLSKAKDAAEAAAQAKSDFMANMSHEIRTPMNAVIGMTSILLDDADLNPEQKDFIETIRMNGDALMVIINDILDFSKMESEKTMLEEQPFDLRGNVEEALDLVSAAAADKKLNLAYSIDKDVPECIIGDHTRLRQILGNLLHNAVKFTECGEVNLSISALEISGTGTHDIHFAVQDTGIGIQQDQMCHLFQPFSQVDATVTRKYGGTGLGLAISKKLVEQMGGSIWVESKPGIGSTFHFTIKADAAMEGKKTLAGVQPQLAGKSVLIVDDNRTNRRILGAYVYSWGMSPLIAASGKEALSWIQRGDTFDVAILDMSMPEMGGLTLAKKIRKYNKSIPLVMLTSMGQRVDPDFFDAYLFKPIKPSQLHKVLINIFVIQQSRESARKASGNMGAETKNLKILLAEDNVSSQKVALQILKRLGYKADVAANGIEVLQALERQPYDLVFMDIRMPEMNGLEATRIIRQRWPDNGPKIVAITAFALEGDKEKCIEAGMDDYISKPIKMNELAEVLSKHQTAEIP